jgi:hypothetical protein
MDHTNNTRLESITEEAGESAPGPSRASMTLNEGGRSTMTLNEGGERKKFRIIKIKKKPQKSMLQTFKSNLPKKNY